MGFSWQENADLQKGNHFCFVLLQKKTTAPYMKSRSFGQLLFFVLFLFAQLLHAQIPQVPLEMEFADLTLRIHPQAQREIQLDVDALYRNASYFKLKTDRVNLYLPFVERELKSQGVPDELKYLVIQESGLVADAVSTSNAVGFWQFKQGTAEEVGLRVDAQVDERKNIVTSSRGAAIYLKKHNNTLNNWMTAMVSYQMGLGGAKAYFGTQYVGKKVVDVDRNTHWYFKKFLAHKIAYQSGRALFASVPSRLMEVEVQGPATLGSLAKRYGVTEAHLIEYNKWAANGKIPTGSFTLFFIKDGGIPAEPTQAAVQPSPVTAEVAPSKTTPAYSKANSFPKITGNTTKATQPKQILVNELEGVQASVTSSPSSFSTEIGVKEKRFLKINDMEANERVEKGAYYYTEKKRPSAEVDTHVVQSGESLWSISQKYGIRLAALKSKNRIRKDTDLRPGMVLNLQESRKRGEEIPVIATQTPTSTLPTPSQPEVRPSSVEAASATSQEPTKPAFHTVSPGETLFSISKKYGLTVSQLKELNGIGEQNLITVGQKLRIIVR
jgi:membrane-bound lytic murein transglycosylase D